MPHKTPTYEELTDLEKKTIKLRGGNPKNQTDIDKFFKMAPQTRRKWKRAAV